MVIYMNNVVPFDLMPLLQNSHLTEHQQGYLPYPFLELIFFSFLILKVNLLHI